METTQISIINGTPSTSAPKEQRTNSPDKVTTPAPQRQETSAPSRQTTTMPSPASPRQATGFENFDKSALVAPVHLGERAVTGQDVAVESVEPVDGPNFTIAA